MHYLDEAASFVKNQKFGDIPSDVIAHGKLVLLDSLAVMIAGSREPHIGTLAGILHKRGSTGRSTFLVNGLTGDAADAAMVNATSACVHVLDEGHKFARGHLATHVVPAALAVGEEQDASGRDVLAAIIVGYEIAARAGLSCRLRTPMHSSGTYLTIGGAAATARLLKLDAPAIRQTMNITAPLTIAASWQAAIDGASVRDLYSGTGGANGVWASRWAAAGFTGANDDVANVFGSISAERAFDRGAFAADLGSRWEILRNYFKIHACCGNFLAGIDAMIALVRDNSLTVSDIDRIDVGSFAAVARNNANATPDTTLAAKESLPVCLGLALVHGRNDQSVFTEANVFDPKVAQIASKVSLRLDPELDALVPAQRPVRISIKTVDGRTLSACEGVPLGDAARPLTPAGLADKFDSVAADSFSPQVRQRIKDAVANLDKQDSIVDLMGLFRRDRAGPTLVANA